MLAPVVILPFVKVRFVTLTSMPLRDKPVALFNVNSGKAVTVDPLIF